MTPEKVLQTVLQCFDDCADRVEAHQRLHPLMASLSQDLDFIHAVLRRALSAGFLERATVLSIPVAEKGDVRLSINLFPPTNDSAPECSADYVHHHGWQLLSTSVIQEGYDTLVFEKNSHLDRDGNRVRLRLSEAYRHSRDEVRFVDAYCAHAVFRPERLGVTLALWSGDKPRWNQGVKKALGPFPAVRRMLADAAHEIGLAEALGLNARNGLFFKPSQGIVMEVPHDGELDVDRAEVATCTLRFLQDVQFEDRDFLARLVEQAPPEARPAIEKALDGETLPDAGVKGNEHRRFTKTQLLDALASPA